MAYDGLSGKYGTIPDDIWLRKLEVTELNTDEGDSHFGDQQQIENHIRNLMVDRRPDRPFLESDQPRGSNIPGSGFFSEQMINLRVSGALTTTDPFLPDGTFLDHEFTERDPRSTASDPDMREFVKQERARGSFYNYRSDADNSVPESGINPVKMVANIKSGFYPMKDRKQIFDESFDSWHNGGVVKRPKNFESDAGKTLKDGTILDLTEASYLNRQDAITKLSNDPTMAYRHSVPDQRFKIARYGNNRMSQSLKTQDWSANRASSFLDTDIGKVAEQERVNTELANAIIDLQGIRDTKQITFQGAMYGDSAAVQNLQMQVPTEVLNKILFSGIASQSDPANMTFEDSYLPRHADRQQHIKDDMDKVEYNHSIIESMASVNKKMKEREMDDLRGAIEQSAADYGLYKEDGNRSKVEKSDRLKQLLNQISTHSKENSKEVANYAAAPVKQEFKILKAAFEAYAKTSDESGNKKRLAPVRNLGQNVKNYGATPLYEEGNPAFMQSKGSMRNKMSVRQDLDRTDEVQGDGDLETFYKRGK